MSKERKTSPDEIEDRIKFITNLRRLEWEGKHFDNTIAEQEKILFEAVDDKIDEEIEKKRTKGYHLPLREFQPF